MNKSLNRTIYRACLLALLALAGCTNLNQLDSQVNSMFRDINAETREAQQIFDSQKYQVENMAHAKQISWAEAARRTREADRSLAGRGRWKFDSNEEEYHAYCMLAAEQLDIGKITFSHYDALRTRKFNDILKRGR